MTQFARKVQTKISKGWRKEAEKLGQRWNVVRNGVVLYTNRPFIVTHWRDYADVEMDPISYIYRIRGDRGLLQIGDHLVGVDGATREGMSNLLERYTVVSMRLATRQNIAIRTDDRCFVYRPVQQAPPATYNWQDISNHKVLRYADGAWAFVDWPATPSEVWVGITFGSSGAKRNASDELPYGTPQQGWMLSLGVLPGVTFREGDIFVDSDGDRYIVDRPYFQLEGAVVNQLHATRLRH